MSKKSSEAIEEMIDGLGKAVKDNKKYTRTGCLVLDLLCGGGQGLGIKQGTWLSIVSDPSIGKSQLLQEIIACAYWDDPKGCLYNYDDVERGNSFDHMALYGIDIIKDSVYQSDTIEKLDTNLKLFIDKVEKKKYKHGIYGVDSITQITTEASLSRQGDRINKHLAGKTLDKGSYEMDKPKFISQHLVRDNQQRAYDNNVTVILVEQFRENVNAGLFQSKKLIPGGQAKEFSISTRLILRSKSKITKSINGKDYVIGYCVEASLHKSRTPRPERKVNYVFYTDYGIHDIQSSLEYLFDLRDDKGKLTSEAKSITWNVSEGCKEKSKDNVTAFLEEHEIFETVKKSKIGKWRYNLPFIEEWIVSCGTEEHKREWAETFGESYALDALCKLIEDSPEMKEELDRRVYEKWEGIEAMCRTSSKPKYADKY